MRKDKPLPSVKRKKKIENIETSHDRRKEIDDLLGLFETILLEMHFHIKKVNFDYWHSDTGGEGAELNYEELFCKMVNYQYDIYANSWEGETFLGIFELMIDLSETITAEYKARGHKEFGYI